MITIDLIFFPFASYLQLLKSWFKRKVRVLLIISASV